MDIKALISSLTIEDIKGFYSIYKSNFHNRITKFIVFTGIGLLSTHWIYDLIDAFFEFRFEINIFGDKSDIFGVVLILIALIYNYFLTSLHINKFIIKSKKSTDHDINVFERISINEEIINRCILDLQFKYIDGTIWEKFEYNKLLFQSVDNKFRNSELQSLMDSLTCSIDNFSILIYQSDPIVETKPEFKGGFYKIKTDPNNMKIYKLEDEELVEKIKSICKEIHISYSNLRVQIREQLSI